MLQSKHIARLSIGPALLRWSRMFICLLFTLTIVAHIAHDSSALAEASGKIAVIASSDMGHDGIPKQSKTIEQCAYVGGCSLTLPPAALFNLTFSKVIMFTPKAGTFSSGNIAGRLFRPPRLHSLA